MFEGKEKGIAVMRQTQITVKGKNKLQNEIPQNNNWTEPRTQMGTVCYSEQDSA